MSLYAPFNTATGPKMSALEAEFTKAEWEQKAKAEANSLRSGNIIGGAELYNAGMGDKSPIADYMFGGDAVDPSGAVAPVTPVSTATMGAEEAAVAEMAGGGDTIAALLAAQQGGAAVNAGAPLAVGSTAGTGAAGGAAAATAAGGAGLQTLLSTLGPAGWAAMLGSALLG